MAFVVAAKRIAQAAAGVDGVKADVKAVADVEAESLLKYDA